MRFAIVMVLGLCMACPPATEEQDSDEQTTSGGEGETEVIVERVDENGDEDEGVLSDEPPAEQAVTCTSSSDCPEGQQCYGEAGCDTTWTCQDPRPCTRDLVTYCACSGETVQGSGSCPPEPYSARGACGG